QAMASKVSSGGLGAFIVVLRPLPLGQGIPADEPVRGLVGRLDLERYKATIKGLTGFGDRRQGTDRNRAAIDWIERQLKSFGCNTERIKYEYHPPAQSRPQPRPAPSPVIASGEIRPRAGGSRSRGTPVPTGRTGDTAAQPE